MNRIEPNLLLALSTTLSMALLISSAILFGAEGHAVKYVVTATVCAVAFVVMNGWWSRRQGLPQTPMIRRDAPSTAAWSALFPAMLILGAAIPMLFPGHDYGLLVLICAIWLGLTILSALRARRG